MLVNRPPVVELDSESHAAYVRLSKTKVAKTLVVEDKGITVTVDVDKNGNAVGIELIGVRDFTVQSLIKKARLQDRIPKEKLQGARYIPVPGPAEVETA